MGLFRSSPKPPPQPLPNVDIHLANPEQIYTPNTTIRGTVTLATPTPIQPTAIETTFWGHSSTWIRTSSSSSSSNSTDYTHYRDSARLFGVTIDVLPNQNWPPLNPTPSAKDAASDAKKEETAPEGPPGYNGESSSRTPQLLTPGQIYEFPFSFLVPGGTSGTRSGIYHDESNSQFTIHPHALPPSFFCGVTKDMPDNAEIEYGVTARVVCPWIVPDKKNDEYLSATAPVYFQPGNIYLDPSNPASSVDLESTAVRTIKDHHISSSLLAAPLSSDPQPPRLTFRRKLADAFSSSTPTLRFTLAVSTPTILSATHAFPLTAHIHITSLTPSITHIPPLTARILKLELEHNTSWRAPYDHDASNTMGGSSKRTRMEPYPVLKAGDEGKKKPRYGRFEDSARRKQKVVLNALPEMAKVEFPPQAHAYPFPAEKGGEKGEGKAETDSAGVEGAMQSREAQVRFEARVPGDTPPSFASWAISRSYRVKVKMAVECAGKKVELEAKTDVAYLGGGGI